MRVTEREAVCLSCLEETVFCDFEIFFYLDSFHRPLYGDNINNSFVTARAGGKVGYVCTITNMEQSHIISLCLV